MNGYTVSNHKSKETQLRIKLYYIKNLDILMKFNEVMYIPINIISHKIKQNLITLTLWIVC